MATFITLTNKYSVNYYKGEARVHVNYNNGFFDLNEAAAVLLWTIGADNLNTWMEKIDASLRRTGKDLASKSWNISFRGGRATTDNGRFDTNRYKVRNGFGWTGYSTPLFSANGFEIGVATEQLENIYFYLLTADLDSIDTSKVADALTPTLTVERVDDLLSEELRRLANFNNQLAPQYEELGKLEADKAALKQALEIDALTSTARKVLNDELERTDECETYVARRTGYLEREIAALVRKITWRIEQLLEDGVSADTIRDYLGNWDYLPEDGAAFYNLLQEEEARKEAEQVARVKEVLKDLKHYGQALMAPGGDDYCEIVYGQHNTITNSGGYSELEPVAGHTIYVSSDHSSYGFDPFTIGQRKHSKLWRIVKVNADGTRTYHYTAKKWSAKAVLIATAAGLDADDLFKGDPCEMYGKMRDLMELIDTAKGGK